MQKRRVVITGLGAISTLGLDVPSTWANILKGKSGIAPINKFDASSLACKIAGQVDSSFNPENYIEPRDVRKMDVFIQYGIAAATEAIADSGWQPVSEEDFQRTGVMLGSGIGGLKAVEEAAIALHQGSRVGPYFIASCLINLLSGHVSIKYGYRGPNHAVATACATGAHAIGDAARLIKYGDADVMIAGGAEASVTLVGVAGFAASKALSTGFNDRPTESSRPWDKAHDGFVMGEGAGVIVLEEYEHAKKRGAKIYAEVAGYGLAGDAHHMTSPHPEGRGAIDAMKNALRDAETSLAEVDYINAHGTSTPMGDGIELNAVQKLFVAENPKLLMSSTKSMTGHLLGAAGSLEAIFATLAVKDNIAPPTINLHDPIDGVMIDLVAHKPKERNMNIVMTNSFGFGGTNASIVLKKI
ncbi:MAG: beta-ketoacyl-ACP synthase II [Pseudomonadota bacterium]